MKQKALRIIFFLIGALSLLLGIIGMVLPVMPTVPFVLLAAACFARSSPRFHHWIHHHRYFGPIINDFQAGLGIPRNIRNRTIAMMWLGMVFSMLIIGALWSVFLLGSIGSGVTYYLLSLPVKTEPSDLG